MSFGRRSSPFEQGGGIATILPPITPASVREEPEERPAPPTSLQSASRPMPVSTAPAMDLRTLCLMRIDPVAAANMPPERLGIEIERLLAEIADENRMQLNGREQRQLATELVGDMLGLGPIEPLLADESITDIMINGPDRVFIEQRGKVTLSNVRFRDAQHVGNIAQRIATAVGRRVDESSPMCDARLADGSRVNIIFPPLALNGACISIRKFAKRKIDFDKLVANGSMTPTMRRLLEICARSRLNILISGGTGSGKTTMMNALSQMIHHGERVITIEDAAELQLQQPHVVRLETRPPNMEGRGEVTQRDLMKNALRMRPDRIIVGEVRGAEAFDMLQAMNTGHDGSMSTIHANTAREAISRVENMVQMGQANLPQKAIRQQIVAAVDLIIQVGRMRDGVRRVSQVAEVVGMEGDVVTMNDIALFEYEGENSDGTLRGRYKMTGARPSFWERLQYYEQDRAWQTALEEGARV